MLIQKYTITWVTDFTTIAAALQRALQGIQCTVEHIGSTAVPELDAKAIIDIDIVYYSPADFVSIACQLERLGYHHNGNQGISDREVFKRSPLWTADPLDNIQQHLYVCPAHSKALERHILTRNFLRKNDWARQEYQEMKYRLAEMAGQDKKRYALLKELHVNDFIDAILRLEKQSQQYKSLYA